MLNDKQKKKHRIPARREHVKALKKRKIYYDRFSYVK